MKKYGAEKSFENSSLEEGSHRIDFSIFETISTIGPDRFEADENNKKCEQEASNCFDLLNKYNIELEKLVRNARDPIYPLNLQELSM